MEALGELPREKSASRKAAHGNLDVGAHSTNEEGDHEQAGSIAMRRAKRLDRQHVPVRSDVLIHLPDSPCRALPKSSIVASPVLTQQGQASLAHNALVLVREAFFCPLSSTVVAQSLATNGRQARKATLLALIG